MNFPSLLPTSPEAKIQSAPAGMLGIGITTALFGLHLGGFLPFDIWALRMAIFYGGLAQIIIGILDWKKNHAFNSMFFIFSGLFWLLPTVLADSGFSRPLHSSVMAIYSALMGVIFSIELLHSNQFPTVIFGTLAMLFFLLSVRQLDPGHGYRLDRHVDWSGDNPPWAYITHRRSGLGRLSRWKRNGTETSTAPR